MRFLKVFGVVFLFLLLRVVDFLVFEVLDIVFLILGFGLGVILGLGVLVFFFFIVEGLLEIFLCLIDDILMVFWIIKFYKKVFVWWNRFLEVVEL